MGFIKAPNWKIEKSINAVLTKSFSNAVKTRAEKIIWFKIHALTKYGSRRCNDVLHLFFFWTTLPVTCIFHSLNVFETWKHHFSVYPEPIRLYGRTTALWCWFNELPQIRAGNIKWNGIRSYANLNDASKIPFLDREDVSVLVAKSRCQMSQSCI